ncbi:MAG: hypothetical protein ABIQ55_03935 [Gemmatimonadaceae bacterium]
MALVLVVGSDLSSLEGISQTLGGAGHQVVIAQDVAEAHDMLRGIRPLVALVDRGALVEDAVAHPLPLMRGGALVTFRGPEENAEHFPFRLPRATLAELQLPLERQRLLALVKFVEDRARACGRAMPENDAPEDQARPG